MSKINTLSNKIILMFRKNIYVKNNLSPFKISRTKIDLYFDCKRCFYIDQKYGIKRPHGAALVINNHIVNKFKKNLEILRNTKTIIPETTLISESGFTALDHPRVSHWTDPFKGIESFHKTTNMTVNASIDDIWTDDEKCYPVIIKSISRESKDVENSIWPGYTRQLSLYGHLLQNNDLEIGDFGMIVIINTENDLDHSNLNFKFYIFKRNLELNWIDTTLSEIKILLENDNYPKISNNCKFCNYVNNINNLKK